MASKPRANRRLIATGVGAGLLLGGTSGLALTLPSGAFAQEETTTTEAPPRVPAEGGPAEGRPEGRPGGPIAQVLDELVASGTITEEQAEAIVGAAEARRAEAHAAPGMSGPGMESRGMGGPGMHGPGERGPGGPGGRGASLETAAEAIGVSVEELRTQLRDGQSLAAIAEANGVSTETLVDALTADAREHITEMVQRVPGEKPGS